MSFGKCIENARVAMGLTKGKFAALMGVSRNTIWAWEANRGFPEPKRMKHIADMLNVPEMWLHNGDENASKERFKDIGRAEFENELMKASWKDYKHNAHDFDYSFFQVCLDALKALHEECSIPVTIAITERAGEIYSDVVRLTSKGDHRALILQGMLCVYRRHPHTLSASSSSVAIHTK